MLTMLRALQRRGHACAALTTSCFDSAPIGGVAAVLSQRGLKQSGRLGKSGPPVWTGMENGVRHTVLQTSNSMRPALTAFDEHCFHELVRDWLQQDTPDVVLTYGGMVLDGALRRLVRRSGAAVVFYLANPTYARASTFEDVDRLITNSDQTAALYRKRLGLDAENVGLYVDPAQFIANDREPRFFTLVNPLPEKGVSLFLRLVDMASRQAPDMQFLVVEGRGRLQSAVEQLKMRPDLLSRVKLLPTQQDMRQVYRQTRVLLMPSFWFEAAGRVLIEAVANGIPVLATGRGGIPETLAGGGTLLDVPERCLQNHWLVPSEAEAAPWWQAMRALHEDEVHYQAMSARALAAAATHDLGHKAARLEQVLQDAIDRRRQAGVAASLA